MTGALLSSLDKELASLRAKRDDIDCRIQEVEAQRASLLAAEAADDRLAGPAVSSRAGTAPASTPVLHDGGCKSEVQTEDVACTGPRTWLGAADGELSARMIARYSRHLLVPSFGAKGQAKLSAASVLIVGAGGLGAPAALYLAAAGVGRLGIADRDIVELSNLHRQVVHSEATVGQHKALSAAAACRALNSWIQVEEHLEGINAANVLDIIKQYSVVVDATDNAASRYLLSDACVVAGRPLVSGAALGVEGQLTVYAHKGGPCYRCLFPQPPPQAACQRCADSGVLGVVPGIIGCLQALEAVKVAAEVGEPLAGRMLLLDALSARVHTVKLRGRMPGCAACGDHPEVTEESLPTFDYLAFTQAPLHDQPMERRQVVPLSQAVAVVDYQRALAEGLPHVLLDVRAAHEFAIAALPGALNIPLRELQRRLPEVHSLVKARRGGGPQQGVDGNQEHDPQAATWQAGSQPGDELAQDESVRSSTGSRGESVRVASMRRPQSQGEDGSGRGEGVGGDELPLFVICRRGNDSQLAVKELRSAGIGTAWDVTGGLEAWARIVDPSFPIY